MRGLTTDADGGDGREGLAKEMNEYSRTYPLNEFLIAACYYHGFNLMMASRCEKSFGDGGTSSGNLIQSLCACYAI